MSNCFIVKAQFLKIKEGPMPIKTKFKMNDKGWIFSFYSVTSNEHVSQGNQINQTNMCTTNM
jgi:hypothetical protein